MRTDTRLDGAVIKPQGFAPVFQAFTSIHDVSSCVPPLFPFCSPPAIIGLVASIVVDTIKGQSLLPSAGDGPVIEGLELLPVNTYGDTSAPIVLITSGISPATPIFNPFPYTEKRVTIQPM